MQNLDNFAGADSAGSAECKGVADPVVAEVCAVYRDLQLTKKARGHEQEALRLQETLSALLTKPETRDKIDTALTQRASNIRKALELWRLAQQEAANQDEIYRIYEAVGAEERFITPAESCRIADLQTETQQAGAQPTKTQPAATTSDPAVLQILATLKVRLAKKELAEGLLQTAQMKAIIRAAKPTIARGEPMLLIGETGGAKTALAEFLANRISPKGHEFISGYGDISSTQVIGAHELHAEGDATVSVFQPGPLLRAMQRGTPVILDEINAMPPDFLKRLNRILQLVPGDTYRVQENAGRPVTVAKGFVIIATANDQSSERYQGVFALSAELINRFGASTFRVHYPDSPLEFADLPHENILLASAAISSPSGDLPPHVKESEVIAAARVAFISQQIFAGRYGEGFADFIASDQIVDQRPGLEQNVLAPRTLVVLLENVRTSGGALSVGEALHRFVEGVMHRTDRHVLAEILRSQGF